MSFRHRKESVIYPKPGPKGGALIRQVIGFLKEQGLSLPLNSHILIGCSGGGDSVAMAHLLLKYGRRVCPPELIRLIHINHGWRGKASLADQSFVEALAKKHQAALEVFQAPLPRKLEKKSWEDVARLQRKKIFEKNALKLGKNTLILTAHTADDLAETVLWRMLTGAKDTHGAGILARHQSYVRPFLKIRKHVLQDFLKEEKLKWREDLSNRDPRFLRARIRSLIMPQIEEVFPRAVEHLVKQGLSAQKPRKFQKAHSIENEWQALLGFEGVLPRRAHWEMLEKLRKSPKSQWEIHLPGGWRLEHQSKNPRKWILEKLKNP